MAKKKKSTRRVGRPRPRRRMSGITTGLTGDLMELAGIVAGSVAATVAQRQLSSVNQKVIAAGEIAVGLYMKKHGGHPFLHGMGYGMMGAGAIGIAHDFRIIAGVEDFMNGIDNEYSQGYVEEGYVHGFQNERLVAGFGNEMSVGGTIAGFMG